MNQQIAKTELPSEPVFYKELLDQISDGVYFVDRSRKIHYWNQGAVRLTGYKPDELLGRYCDDNILCHVDMEGNELCKEKCPLAACINDGKFREADVFLRHKEGKRVPVHARVHPLRDEDGQITGAIEIFNDNTAQMDTRRKIEEMRRLAFLDHLTQLPNRRFLEMLVNSALNEFHYHKEPFGILVFDIDNFKQINDSYGHSCGDSALQEIAMTINGSLRPSDTIGRWGGDEFLVIARNVNKEIIRGLAERCAMLIRQISIPAGNGVFVTVSISVGGALSHAGESVQELIDRADGLMYRSKAAGKDYAITES
jgi:diguanylate cyclase (GGDEF)-like protein/PAS domain S-box-containing protein